MKLLRKLRFVFSTKNWREQFGCVGCQGHYDCHGSYLVKGNEQLCSIQIENYIKGKKK